MVAVGIFAALLLAYSSLGTAAISSNLQPHEARAGIPAGFSSHGAAPPDTVLQLRIALVQGNFPGLEERLYDVSTPSSRNYGKHLSKEEVEAYVAPKPESVTAVNAWLSDNGVHATPVSPAGDWLAVEMPVSKANELLGAHYSVYQHDATGRTLIRTLSYSIPTHLKGHLDLVHPTTTFAVIQSLVPAARAPPPVPRAHVQSDATNVVPASCLGAITPLCLQALYDIPTTPATESTNGLGVTGYFAQNASEADLKDFLQEFRKDMNPNTTFSLKSIDGGQNDQTPGKAGIEANSDIEYTVGVATAVPVRFITVGDKSSDGLDGFLDTINALLNETAPPQVLTTSYGFEEAEIFTPLALSLCNAYAQLGARGISILFASGDGGVAGAHAENHPTCDTFVPTFPSGCPFLTSVGATTGIGPEVAAAFSSGGFSNVFSAPPYQKPAVAKYIAGPGGKANAGRFNTSGRGYPDVSAQGTNFTAVVNGALKIVSGTSASSPTFASVVALLNDRLLAAGKSPLGFLNPFLYSEAGAGALNDVTAGSNPGCGSTGFPALAGWDPVTGLGTPSFTSLLTAVGLRPESP